jgi:beta-mannanase
VAEAPQRRQLVLAVSLIPVSLENIKDPLGWEQSCASGDFNSYASELGSELVGAGLENSVIRLGPEMNGTWEDDFVGTTIQEQSLWVTCFQNEATALRQVSGQHFLIDWNPNACVENLPYSNFYPGNAYVDIMGLDLFDVGCLTPRTPLTFTQLEREPAGLLHFEDFAAARGKPMSFPEWGLMLDPSGDNPGYVDGIGATINRQDFAFETYFDANLEIRPYLPLGSRTPLSLAAFQKWFSNGS